MKNVMEALTFLSENWIMLTGSLVYLGLLVFVIKFVDIIRVKEENNPSQKTDVK